VSEEFSYPWQFPASSNKMICGCRTNKKHIEAVNYITIDIKKLCKSVRGLFTIWKEIKKLAERKVFAVLMESWLDAIIVISRLSGQSLVSQSIREKESLFGTRSSSTKS